MTAGSITAQAQHLDVSDRRDTRDALDISDVQVDRVSNPRFWVKTWGRWTVKDIFDRGYVLVFFDTFGSSRFDYYALVRSRGNRLEASLWRDFRRSNDRQRARLLVRRRNRRSVNVIVPLRKMYVGRRVHYGWRVQTLMTSRTCRRVCFDLAPDEGAVMEPVPPVP